MSIDLTPDNNEAEKAESIEQFILRLSCAPNLSQDEAVQAILDQLKILEQNKYFSEVFAELADSDCFSYAKRKGLNEDQRRILCRAINEYQ